MELLRVQYLNKNGENNWREEARKYFSSEDAFTFQTTALMMLQQKGPGRRKVILFLHCSFADGSEVKH